jgi:maltooligosyltrehalose trehalohydrolase
MTSTTSQWSRSGSAPNTCGLRWSIAATVVVSCAAFRSAVLKWNERESASGRKRVALVRELLSIRKREIARRLPRSSFGEAAAEHNGLVTASWRMGDGATLRLTANLSAREIAYNSEQATGTLIWGGETGDRLRPWSVFWRIGG